MRASAAPIAGDLANGIPRVLAFRAPTVGPCHSLKKPR